MSATLSTSSPIEIPAITAEQIARISDAYGDAQSTLVARVRALRPLLTAGHTVKGIHAAMLSAAASDGSITVVSTTVYGYAAAAAILAGSIEGLPFSKVSSADLALFARAAKHVGVGPFKSAARNVIGSMSDDAGADMVLIALRDAFTLAVSMPRADHVKASEKLRAENERAARNAGGMGDDGETVLEPVVINGERVSGRIVATDSADVLASIHAATKYLQDGGEYSDDLASAVSQLASALSAARKRTRSTIAA